MSLTNGKWTKHPENGNWTMKTYYKQLYARSFDNLKEVDQSSKSTDYELTMERKTRIAL